MRLPHKVPEYVPKKGDLPHKSSRVTNKSRESCNERSTRQQLGPNWGRRRDGTILQIGANDVMLMFEHGIILFHLHEEKKAVVEEKKSIIMHLKSDRPRLIYDPLEAQIMMRRLGLLSYLHGIALQGINKYCMDILVHKNRNVYRFLSSSSRWFRFGSVHRETENG